MNAIEPYDAFTPIPFGEHIGKPLGEIPAEYFMHLWKISDNGEKLSDAKLAKYIRDNFRDLEMKSMQERQRRFYERK